MATVQDTMGVTEDQLDSGNKGVAPGAPVVVDPAVAAAAAQAEVDAAALAAKTPEQIEADKATDLAASEQAAKAQAEADKAAEEAANNAAVDATIVSWDKVGHPSVDAAIDIMQEKGMNPADAQEVFGDALKSSNLEDVDQAKLAAKIGDASALLVMNGIKAWHKEAGDKANATVASVHEAVGGADNWTALQTWSKTTDSPEFAAKVKDFRTMLNAGGTQAVLAAREMKQMHEAANGTLDKGLTTGGDNAPTANVQPMNRSEYLAEMKIVEYGDAKGHHMSPAAKATARTALSARRKAGREAGI